MIYFGAPVYRRYDLLSSLFESLQSSTLKPDRVIVVDNGQALGLPMERKLIWKTSHDDRGDLVWHLPVVVSPGQNTGCSGAWNLILDQAQPEDLVIISNDDILLAPESIQLIVDAASKTDLVIAHGFSLFALKRRLVDEVGFFDENFHPCYYEDLDFHRRVRLAKKSWMHLDALAKHPIPSATMKSLNAAEHKVFSDRQSVLKRYYMMKWGGVPPKTDERFDAPFRGHLPKGWKLRPVTQP